jgi:hypothetical protein
MQRLLTFFICSAAAGCVVDASTADDAIVAQSILPGQFIIQQAVASNPPSARGGAALFDGEYDLVASKLYIGADGNPAAVQATFLTARLVLSHGQIQVTTTRDGATTRQAGSLVFCGAGMAITSTSWPTTGTTRAVSFTTHGDTLEIFDQDTIDTYNLRPGTRAGIEHPATGAACKQAPGVCGGLANVGPWVTEQNVVAAAPVGRAGNLVLEIPYVMTSDVYYNGASPSGSRDKITLVAHADTTFEFVQDVDQGGAARLSGTYTTVGNALTFNITCSPFGAFPLPFTYDARLGVLQTIEPGGPNHDTGTECMTYHAAK